MPQLSYSSLSLLILLQLVNLSGAAQAKEFQSSPGTQLLGQSSGEVRATPIPAVESNSIELKEIKPTLSIEIKAGQERLFRTKRKITRVAVSDSSVAEPVVVSEREILLIGKTTGPVSLFIWFEGSPNSIPERSPQTM